MIPISKENDFNLTQLSKYVCNKLQIAEPSSFHILQINDNQLTPKFYLNFLGKEMVLHKKPIDKLLPDPHAFYREYTVMNTLGKLGFPVLETLLYCSDSSIIGSEFYITKFFRGRVFRDPSLPGIPPEERHEIYMEMVRVLAVLHSFDLKNSHLQALVNNSGKDFLGQIKAYETKAKKNSSMDKLVDWLHKNIPQTNNEIAAFCHGDYRLENIIFHETEPKILAVLQWKSAGVGHPFVDLAHNCTAYRIPKSQSGQLLTIGKFDKGMYGIPSERKLVQEYCKRAGVPVKNLMGPNKIYWKFYLSFSLFRLACVYHEVHKKLSISIANTACEIAKSNQEAFKRTIIDDLFGFSENYYKTKQKLFDFMEEHIYPNERVFISQVNKDPNLRWKVVPPIIKELQLKAKEAGLWNMFLPSQGPKLNFLEYASLLETMASSFIDAEVFNCSAPDGGNISALIMFGNNEQKEKWLQPLLEGEIKSAIAMTEPGIASSDLTNIESTVIKDPLNPDYYLINGRKSWVSGGGDPRCKVIFFVGRTPNPKKGPHQQHSMILVPVDAEGVKKVRPFTSLGYDEPSKGYWEYLFTNVRVHKSNLFVEEGKGFEIAQIRMGPGKIGHCMKLIGLAQRSFDAMCMRAANRKAFGKLLMDHGTVMSYIASSKIELHQMRLMALYAAKCVMTKGANNSREEIAGLKIAAPKMALRVIERAINVHGAGGLSEDFILVTALRWAKNMRFIDGPDEVHEMTIAKIEMENYIDAKL